MSPVVNPTQVEPVKILLVLNCLPGGNLINPNMVEEIFTASNGSWVIRMGSGKEHYLKNKLTFDQVCKIIAGEDANIIDY